jgi:hypothetical protein
MDAAGSSKTLVTTYQTVQYHNPENQKTKEQVPIHFKHKHVLVFHTNKTRQPHHHQKLDFLMQQSYKAQNKHKPRKILIEQATQSTMNTLPTAVIYVKQTTKLNYILQ